MLGKIEGRRRRGRQRKRWLGGITDVIDMSLRSSWSWWGTGKPVMLQSMASGQITGREHSPAHQQKIRLKIYWAWPCPSEQDPASPTVSLSHQEASISLLSLFIRGLTVWKPQSQKLIKLITWTTALSNSMKLWAMPCRATQNKQVMVESSDKTWDAGEWNGKSLQYSCQEQYEKAKRYDTEGWTPQVSRCPICHWRRVEK